MFNDRFDEAIRWSRKAIALAEELGEIETRIHALNNLGGSMLFAGDAAGKVYMEESLAIALEHGFHDLADRAYTNYAEYAIIAKEFDLAERLLSEAIAFNTRHDLDAGIQMLTGRQAQLRMEQGRFAEAEAIASDVLGRGKLSLVVKLPALMVLAKTRMRLGREDGQTLMHEAAEVAFSTEEQQNIVPARLGLIEAAWLAGDESEAQTQLDAMLKLHLEGLDGWDMGTFAVWWWRCRRDHPFPKPHFSIAKPRQAELAGDAEGACQEWLRLGLPYEAALALMSSADGLQRAAQMLEELGAAPAAAKARSRAKGLGLTLKVAKTKRGPYAIARQHPLGLTGRENDVLELMAQGLGNSEIARRLNRSPRTVEHHVSAVLGKLNASNRMDVMLRLRNEPWLISASVTENRGWQAKTR
jgi:DNA-binding CsgD family transcriptional regulator